MGGSLLDFYRRRFGQAIRRQGNGWNGPCPLCGGQPGKSDRFMVWPERSESLGELCEKNRIAGIWSCRQCGESGDTIAYLVKCEGLNFKDALAELGIEGSQPRRRRRAPATPPKPAAWQPKTHELPGGAWREQAQKLVARAEKAIWDNAGALGWLAARGIDEETVRKYRLGYLNPENDKCQGLFRPRASFGLAPKTGADGKRRDKLFIPRGILIPTLGATGEILNIRIRRHKADLREGSPKYLELEGSCRGPLFLPSSQPLRLAVYFVTEAELDAMLIHHKSGGVVGAVAVRTNRGKPDARCNPALVDAVRVCVALDYDEAGAAGCGFWENAYPNSTRWPTPEGKDPGDAFALGVDISEWIAAALPDCVSLPSRPDTVEEAVQAESSAPAAGQEDATATGRENLRNGGQNPESGKWPSEARAAIAARANAPDWHLEKSRWNDTQPLPFPWASENNFTQGELALLKAALPPSMPLDYIFLDVAVIWLLWRRLPITFAGTMDKAGNATGIRWEYAHDWAAKNSGQLDEFWRHQSTSRAFWRWLSDHPAERITSRNLLDLWGAMARKMKV